MDHEENHPHFVANLGSQKLRSSARGRQALKNAIFFCQISLFHTKKFPWFPYWKTSLLSNDGRAMSICNFLLLRPCTVHIGCIAKITKPLRILNLQKFFQNFGQEKKICNDPTASNIHIKIRLSLTYLTIRRHMWMLPY